MIKFSCDSCQAVKAPDEIWILGLAAEAVGFTAARREVNILSGWDYANAVHPLAVHFCSESCKENYIDKLFGKNEKAVQDIQRPVSRPKARSKVKKVRREVA
jgi:hypothetical protein